MAYQPKELERAMNSGRQLMVNNRIEEVKKIRYSKEADELYDIVRGKSRLSEASGQGGHTLNVRDIAEAVLLAGFRKFPQPLDEKELREKQKGLIASVLLDEGVMRSEVAADMVALKIRQRLDAHNALLQPKIEEARRQIACDLFEEIICPLCYRLNPQHADMDNGKGCHYCQEREERGALKGGG